jgi:hypothetical protein
MNLEPDSLSLYLKLVRSVIFFFAVPLYKYVWNFFSRSAHPVIEFGSSDENQLKDSQDRDNGKNQTLCASSIDAPPC